MAQEDSGAVGKQGMRGRNGTEGRGTEGGVGRKEVREGGECLACRSR